jgi:hypothetical protein
VTPGNLLFFVGAVIEMAALPLGVDSRVIGVTMILYGGILLVTGYLR